MPASRSPWSKLPPPVVGIGMFVGGCFAFIIMLSLSRRLGGVSLLLAAVFWLAVVTGVLHAAGKLPWLTGQPYLGAGLDAYAPRILSGHASRSPFVGAWTTGAETSAVTPDVSHFAGLEGVYKRLRILIENQGILANKVADAPLLLLLGPRGTGKSSVARSLPPRLLQAGILKTDKLVSISTTDFPGLSDSQGPDVETWKGLSARLRDAVDGVILLDNLDYLLSLPSGNVMQEIGSRLAQLAHDHRGRIVIIGTGSLEIEPRLDPGQDWITDFDRLRVPFPPLNITALETIAKHLLQNDGLVCSPSAADQLSIQLQWLAEDSGFTNAHAVRSLVGEILHARAERLRSDPAKGPMDAKQVIEADIPRRSGT